MYYCMWLFTALCVWGCSILLTSVYCVWMSHCLPLCVCDNITLSTGVYCAVYVCTVCSCNVLFMCALCVVVMCCLCVHCV